MYLESDSELYVKAFDQYGSSSAGASGKVANTGIPDTSSLGLVVDLYSDLHSPVRLGPSSRYGEHVMVRNVRLNKSLPEIIETSEFGLWEEDPFLLELIRWKGYENWTTYADALLRDKRLLDPSLRTLTNIDFGQIGCFNNKLATSMFSTWANESAALLRAESCLSDNKLEKGCSQDFFQNLANSLELRLLTCSLRVANSMDLLFITPPDNVISPLCKKMCHFPSIIIYWQYQSPSFSSWQRCYFFVCFCQKLREHKSLLRDHIQRIQIRH